VVRRRMHVDIAVRQYSSHCDRCPLSCAALCTGCRSIEGCVVGEKRGVGFRCVFSQCVFSQKEGMTKRGRRGDCGLAALAASPVSFIHPALNTLPRPLLEYRIPTTPTASIPSLQYSTTAAPTPANPQVAPLAATSPLIPNHVGTSPARRPAWRLQVCTVQAGLAWYAIA
jgi:hypothetical protein